MNEVIETIIQLLKDNLQSDYKKIYYWEVRVPEDVNLPHIEVVPLGSKLSNRGTGWMMNNEYNVMVIVKTSMKKYLTQGRGSDVIKHTQDLIKRIEERDTDGELIDNCVMGVLHNNLQLTRNGVRFADINDDWTTTYQENDLGESFILYATISFVVKRIT